VVAGHPCPPALLHCCLLLVVVSPSVFHDDIFCVNCAVSLWSVPENSDVKL
jgi:hypothetical protein